MDETLFKKVIDIIEDHYNYIISDMEAVNVKEEMLKEIHIEKDLIIDELKREHNK